MLIKCPECELQVSDKAYSCPHCGYPITRKSKYTKKRKRRKLPNGFGQIVEIKNQNLRKPFRAMITVGKNEFGKPICKILKPNGYFETYNEAYAALIEYNKKPYEINDVIKMNDLFYRWINDSEYSNTRKINFKTRWSYLTSIHNIYVKDLKVQELKNAIINASRVNENGKVTEASNNTKITIKSMTNMLFDYAIEHEIVDKNISRIIKLPNSITKIERQHHIPFSDNEIKKLINNINSIEYVDLVLIHCYTGLRPNELCSVKLKNVNMEQNYFICGIKTKAGIDRTIPIHEKIKPLIEKYYNTAVLYKAEYLFNVEGILDVKKISYDRYASRFKDIIKRLNLNTDHTPHDCRTHFITTAKKYNLDEYAIKYIVGHKILDITESVYTKRNTDWLVKEVNKIKIDM